MSCASGARASKHKLTAYQAKMLAERLQRKRFVLQVYCPFLAVSATELTLERDCVFLAGARVSKHKLTAYRANMVAVLKAQIKSERVEPGLVGVMELADSVALKVGYVFFHSHATYFIPDFSS